MQNLKHLLQGTKLHNLLKKVQTKCKVQTNRLIQGHSTL